MQIDFKQPAIILGTAGYNRLNRPIIILEPWVFVNVIPCIIIGQGGDTYRTLLERKGAVDARIWTGNTGNRQSDGFDPATIVTRAIRASIGFT